MNKITVIGGGISGIFSSLLLKKKFPNSEVELIETSKSLGGLFNSYTYPNYGRFDYGMHNIYETGISEIDEILHSLLPAEQWDFLEGNNRDLAGIFFNNKIQTNTVFPDTRNLKKNNIYIREIERSVNEKQTKSNIKNATDYFNKKFGITYSQDIIEPILEKTYKLKTDQLSPFAGSLIPLSRVCALDIHQLTNQKENNLFCFPEQRELPKNLIPHKKALYPKERGCSLVTEAAISKLLDLGVTIKLNFKVDSFIYDRDSVIGYNRNKETFKSDLIISTIGPIALARIASIDFKPKFTHKPFHTVIVNFATKMKPNMIQDLHYLFCYDKDYLTYRATFYPNFCSSAQTERFYPFNVELLIDGDLNTDEKHYELVAKEELLRMGIVNSTDDFLFSKSEVLPYGFPRPSTGNIEVFQSARFKIKELGLKNLIVGGVLSEENLFFQGSVISDIYKKIIALDPLM